MKKNSEFIHIFEDWCKGCGICMAFCPQKILGPDKEGKVTVKDPDKCTGCKLCEVRCPDFAIRIQKREKAGTLPDQKKDTGGGTAHGIPSPHVGEEKVRGVESGLSQSTSGTEINRGKRDGGK